MVEVVVVVVVAVERAEDMTLDELAEQEQPQRKRKNGRPAAMRRP